jgi:hypothetical protein
MVIHQESISSYSNSSPFSKLPMHMNSDNSNGDIKIFAENIKKQEDRINFLNTFLLEN